MTIPVSVYLLVLVCTAILEHFRTKLCKHVRRAIIYIPSFSHLGWASGRVYVYVYRSCTINIHWGFLLLPLL